MVCDLLQGGTVWCAMTAYAKLGYSPDTRFMDFAVTTCAADFHQQLFDVCRALAKLEYKPQISILKEVEHRVSCDA